MADKSLMTASAPTPMSNSIQGGDYETPAVNPNDVIFDLGGRYISVILDDTTYNLVKSDLSQAINKAVSVTGNKTVGYGLNGDKLFGVIKALEYNHLATVQIDGVDDKFAGTGIAAGDSITVDGAGGIAKATVANNTVVIDVASDGKIAVKF